MKRLRYLHGLLRLHHGYCPACNSSPPQRSCPVCHGDYRYGQDASPGKRDIWRWRWQDECQIRAKPKLYAD